MLPFDSEIIQRYRVEVSDTLDSNENRVISIIIFWINAVDAELERLTGKGREIRHLGHRKPDSDEMQVLVNEYAQLLDDTKTNLELLKPALQLYIDGKAHEILELRRSRLARTRPCVSTSPSRRPGTQSRGPSGCT